MWFFELLLETESGVFSFESCFSLLGLFDGMRVRGVCQLLVLFWVFSVN